MFPLFSLRYLLFMKMAALQLMQQKANKDSNKTDAPAITETAETPTESNAATTETQTDVTESSNATDGTSQTDNSTSAASQTTTESEENCLKPTTNGPIQPAATQNGECKSPLEGKELEENIPGLAQAKQLAETLVAEDGSGIGTFRNAPKSKVVIVYGELFWWIIGQTKSCF